MLIRTLVSPFVKTIIKNKKNLKSINSDCYKYFWTSYKLNLPTNNNPVIMKISESPQFHACLTNEVLILKDLFAQHGHEIRIVGGAVRDLLLGITPGDLDFATTATPEEMKALFISNNIRLINSNGEKHGTITARIGEKNFEVTSLRVDLVTDGRHAKVQFTKSWTLDANRRDLTINSMYLDFQGNLYDYFNGYQDLQERKIRFVGFPESRIQEDYLRILRYFRFYGKIAREPDNHIEDVLKAIKQNASGLSSISGERIWVELHKICKGNYSYEILRKMIELNVGKYIGFPISCNLNELKIVCDRLQKNGVPYMPMTLLSALFNTEEELEAFFARIKPSTLERSLGLFILLNKDKKKEEKPIRGFQRLIFTSQKPQFTLALVIELLKYNGEMEILKEIESWTIPKLPVGGGDLRALGINGKNIGVTLNKLKQIWVDHDFTTDREHLLLDVKNVITNLPKT